MSDNDRKYIKLTLTAEAYKLLEDLTHRINHNYGEVMNTSKAWIAQDILCDYLGERFDVDTEALKVPRNGHGGKREGAGRPVKDD